MTKNVIEFPKSKIVRDVPFNDEEMAKVREKNRQKYAEEIIAEVSSGLYDELESCGLNSEAESYNKDFIFLSDVLKALVYRNMGIDHPLHEFIDERVHIRTLPASATPEEIQKIIDEMIEEYGNVEEIDSTLVEKMDVEEPKT